MALKLHVCSLTWIKFAHACHRVRAALDDQGIPYEPVYGPLSRGKREEMQRLSGQKLYPVIEFEDGSVYREESRDMAATIRAGKLDEKRA